MAGPTTPATPPAPPSSPSASGGSTAAQDVSILTFPPIVYTIGGIMLLGGFLFAMLLQIQSTEDWMLGITKGASLVPNLSLFMQFPMYWNNQMTPAQNEAFIVGWGVELVYLTLKLGTVRVQAHMVKKYGVGIVSENVLKSAQRRMALWTAASWGMLAFNGFTDWQYAANMDAGRQLIFILAISTMTFFCGTKGIQYLTAGLSKMA